MLLKAIILAASLFLGGVGVLRASVLYQNYVLLAAGMVLASLGLLVVLQKPQRQGRARALRA